MIKAIVFDYGNVISKVDNRKFLEKISRYSKKTGTELTEFISARADLLAHYESGLISSDEFFKYFVTIDGFPFKKEDFIKLFTGRFTPIEETHELIRKIKPGYKLGLLSNTNPWDFEYEIKQCRIFNLFDTITLSFKVGAMKPNEAIYRHALQGLELKPDECVYIDDVREYADAASVIGMHGIHYTSHENLIALLKDLNCRIC